jgi:hypothetical protein
LKDGAHTASGRDATRIPFTTFCGFAVFPAQIFPVKNLKSLLDFCDFLSNIKDVWVWIMEKNHKNHQSKYLKKQF